MKTKQRSGFTLIELIIVIAIIAILAAIVVVTIDPARLFANARNGTRASDMTTIQSALQRFLAESPSGGTARVLYGTSTTSSAFTTNAGVIGTPATAGLISTVTVRGAYHTATPADARGNCPNGSKGGSNLSGLTHANMYSLVTGTATSGNLELDMNNIINLGYLTKTPSDPLGTAATGGQYYKVCIDTSVPSTGNDNSTPGKLVIYAPGIEYGATIPYVVI